MRIAILGNSGSGKSTLAQWLARECDVALLDLDTVAWEPDRVAVPRSTEEAQADVVKFCQAHERWVLEGCYENLVRVSLPFDPLLLFLNPGVETCALHCRNRPWEPHKYRSKEEQDDKLSFLLSWVREYETREGPMSLAAHRALYEGYQGRKVELRRVPQLHPPEALVLSWVERGAK